MATFFPILNPVRFQDSGKIIDYVNNMPQFDLMRLGEDYQRGIYTNKNYKVDFRINTELSFIIKTDNFLYTGVIVDAVIIKPDGSTANISGTKITPAGYIGEPYYKYSYTPTMEGVYQITLIGYTSDNIYVSDPTTLKDLVEINNYDTQNRLNGYWFDETTQKWNPKAYYTGNIVPLAPENEVSIYEGDNGVTYKTRSVPKRVMQLVITEVHFSYLDVINYQLQCDNVYINGIKCTAQDVVPEAKENSDLIDITAKLTQSEEENGFLLT
jgi:hypothetical protein